MLKKLRLNVVVLMFVNFFVSMHVKAITLTNFDVVNNCNKSLIILDFEGVPVYNFYFLHHPERLVLDVPHIFSPLRFNQFPINFFSGELVHCIRVDKLTYVQGIRFIFDLMSLSYVDDVCLEKIPGSNVLLLVITKKLSMSFTDSTVSKQGKKCVLSSYINLPFFKRNKSPFVSYMGEMVLSDNVVSQYQMRMFFPIIVAIDAGHGGHDPGAKGHSGLYEKNVTIAIAKKLNKLLDRDPIFSPFMIRDGDYFISLLDRSELARNKGAKILLSIHADAISKSSKNTARGSSVWVLSDRGASIEMANWLENRTQSRLTGGINDILMRTRESSDQYFHRAILDLQFCHSQRVGYEIALHILRELKSISVLHKYVPEYSNFAVLRSLDIPSILVETGFITNMDEERLLSDDYYQEKMARALYKGLRSYFLGYISCFKNIKKDEKLHFNPRKYSKNLYKNYRCRCSSF